MTMTRRPSPFSELVTLRQAMDRLFDDTVFRPFTAYTGNGDFARLPLDVKATSDALLVEASLPGFAPEDVEITVENGTLTIRAEDKREDTREDGVRSVEFAPWTWGVTGTTYPRVATIAYEQTFAETTAVQGTTHLVQDEAGLWRWFFGSDAAFVAAQIARFAN